MPRPKRSKVASTRVAQPQAATAVATRRNAARQTVQRSSTKSDDSEGLITTTNEIRGRKPRQLVERGTDQEYTMTGGLGEGDVAGAHKLITKPYLMPMPKPPPKAKAKPAVRKITPDRRHDNTMDALRKKRDEAMKAKKKAQKGSSPEVVIPAKRTSRGQATEASSEPNEPPTSAQKPAPSPTPSPSPVKGTYPGSALKAHGTPAMETSMMALTNFKRRSRQPSILRMVQQPSSDNGDDESVNLDFLDGFHPEDESTPLHAHTRTVEDDAAEESTLRSSDAAQSSASRKRKLASPEVQVPASSPPPASSPAAGFAPSSPLSRLATPSEHITETQEVVSIPPSPALPTEPEDWSSTMAPPLSSSPEPPSSSNDPATRHSKRRKTNDDLYDRTPTASDNEAGAARAINAKQPAKAKKAPRAPALSTAKLQALLPRRRQRPRRHAEKQDEFDIPSSDEIELQLIDSDQDELALSAPRRKQSAPTKTPVRGRPSKDAKTLAQLSAVKIPAPAPTAKRGRPKGRKNGAAVTKEVRTYGRRNSDKENADEDEEDESVWVAGETDGEQEEETTVEQVKLSRELQLQARKFKEIDAVDLEFETVDVVDSSSPWR